MIVTTADLYVMPNGKYPIGAYNVNNLEALLMTHRTKALIP